MTDDPGRPCRVTFLLDDLGGGTGNHLLSMMRHWSRARLDPRVISHAPLTSRIAPPAPVTYGPERAWFDRYPLAQVRRFLHARRHVGERPPDVLHAYFFWPIIYGRLLKTFGVVPRLVENREDQGFNWGRHEYALLRATRHVPDRVICVSDAVRRVVLEREGLDPERVIVIRNGIEAPERGSANGCNVREELHLSPEHLVVGMVANMNRAVKGVRYFVEAMPIIAAAIPEARFVLIGGGDNEEERLRGRIRELGISERVRFAGVREDMDACYDSLDLSVLTSLSEGLSIVLLESMQHGLPVVATRVGGNPEVVEEGVTGYLVPPRDPRSFAERVAGLLRDAATREQMGRAAAEKVRREFRLEDVAQAYLRLYEELVGPRNPRAEGT